MERERQLKEQPKVAKTLDEATLDELCQKDAKVHPYLEEYETSRKNRYQELARFVHRINEPNLLMRARNKIKPRHLSHNEILCIQYDWQNFVDNNRVQQALGKDNLNIAEDVINRSMLKELSSSDPGNVEFATHQMEYFKNPTLAPFQVLENFRHDTYELDFGWKKTHGYLSGLPVDKLEELKKTTVPGLRKIVELVTTQPEPLTQEDLIKLKAQATKMTLHYLRDGSGEEKIYIARIMPQSMISEGTKDQITEILENDKTSRVVTMTFFMSHISNDRFKNYSQVALEMLLEYLSRQENPKLKDLLSLYEGELVDKFIEKDEISSQDVVALSKTFGENEENIKTALELARKQKEQNSDQQVRFSHHERSTEGTLRKLVKLSTDKDISSLLTELFQYGYRLNVYQSLDVDLFERLLRQRRALIPFIRQLSEYGYIFVNIDDLENLEYAFKNRETILAALSDIKNYDPEVTYHLYGKDEKYSDPYKQYVSRVRHPLDNAFEYNKLLAIKKVEGHIPRRFSDPLHEILRDESSPYHLDRRRHEMKKEKLPDPSEKTKIEFQKALDTVLECVAKDKEENFYSFQWFYEDRGFLRFLSFNPDRIQEITSIPERFPELPKLMRDNRDAKNRLTQFLNAVFQEELPQPAVATVLESAKKPTELDALGTKLLNNSKIAKMLGKRNWHASLLTGTNFEETNDQLTKIMAELAITVVYSSLERNALTQKLTQLVEKAASDQEFEDILEICCRCVGIYSRQHPRRGTEFNTLMSAIKTSLELNLERNPNLYAQKRFEQSLSQFDRLFQDFPQDVREKTLAMWFDLSKRRRLRVSGSDISDEDATFSRLNRIRDLVQNDLSIHLKTLFIEKIRALEQEIEIDSSRSAYVDQHVIFKRYLFTQEGQLRQDIPLMYLSVERFIHDAQRKLKDPQTLQEEKAVLGRNLGTYQAMSDILKALYRLGTISEKRYKAEGDYLDQIDEHISKMSASLKRVRILDPERMSQDVNLRALEEEVLIDFDNLKGTMRQENVASQAIFETESTVSFKYLAQAPDMTQSCQRLTEVTGYNQAAYSRLLDGINEMVDVYESSNNKRSRLARSFIELSKIKIHGEEKPRLSILFDREYVNPQYQNFTDHFYTEMVAHLLDRISSTPEVSLVIAHQLNPKIETLLKERGYQTKQATAEYFVNRSNVIPYKYYDSAGGIRDVRNAHYSDPQNFYLIEKV